VPGKLPIHLERQNTPNAEDNVGLLISEPKRGVTLGYFPAVAGPSAALSEAIAQCSCFFLDGTFWSSDELRDRGLGDKRAEDMAHWPLAGPRGSLAFLREHATRRRVLIHVNNTNPILRPDSAEAAQLTAAGVELAFDGMELEP